MVILHSLQHINNGLNKVVRDRFLNMKEFTECCKVSEERICLQESFHSTIQGICWAEDFDTFNFFLLNMP